MGYSEHQERAQRETPSRLRCGVITASDTRTAATDTSGALIRDRLTQAGHLVHRYAVAPDEAPTIRELITSFVDDGCVLVITNGGTGIAKRDSTFEAVDALLEKRLPGFGEIFRMLSYQQIGAAAMLSRATAGTYRGALIFALPGSTKAVELAMDALIMPELRHIVWETIRQ
ncbi:MAG: molybdenum cofactor biosynthesis protein MoaB [Dehalococcoidia bacterium]|nr:molybdenum cofactor biosynthesis protein MoaB [Dehalococcoidia bacterium]